MAQDLKAYNVVATADVNPDVVDRLGCTEFTAYDADDVDSVLAEKDAVLAEKDTEIRRLQRALWLARVERAKERKSHFDHLDYFGISVVTINFESARTWMTCKTEEPSKWAIIFEKVEQKCRAKAEEYR